MTRRQFAGALLAATVMTGAIAIPAAHEGHDHKIMGTVTMAAADHVMLKDTDGKDVTVLVTAATKVTRDRKAMKAQDLAAGTRIVVTAVEEKKQMRATEILVGAAAAK